MSYFFFTWTFFTNLSTLKYSSVLPLPSYSYGMGFDFPPWLFPVSSLVILLPRKAVHQKISVMGQFIPHSCLYKCKATFYVWNRTKMGAGICMWIGAVEWCDLVNVYCPLLKFLTHFHSPGQPGRERASVTEEAGGGQWGAESNTE